MATRSYWQLTVPKRLAQIAQPAPAVIDADVAVIGAGYVGAYLALRLHQQGARVAVLDATGLSEGATGRSAGMLLTGLAMPYVHAVSQHGREWAREAWQLTIQTRETLLELAAPHGIPDVERIGSMTLAENEWQALDLRHSRDLLTEDGFAVEYLDQDPLDRGYRAALAFPADLGLHPTRLTISLLRAAEAAVYAPARVMSWDEQAGGVTARGDGFEVRAQQLYVATNAALGELVPDVGDLVKPVRGQVLLTEPLDRRVCYTLAYADEGYQYFRQLGGGRLLLGGGRRAFAKQEVGFEDETTAPVQGALDAYLARVFPELRGVKIDLRWAGTMGFTPDTLPVIGRAGERVAYVGGFSGHGLSLGFAVADRLLSCMQNGASAGILAAERFAGTDAID